MQSHRLALAVFLSLSAAALFAQDDPSLIGHTTGLFGPEKCGPTGDATDTSVPDPYLNALKNRDVAPDSFKHMTIATVVADVPAASEAGKRRRDKWTGAQRKSLVTKEAAGIEVVGYLAGVTHEGKESCNCSSETDKDYHMWLVAKPGDKQAKSMVVELSPRLLSAHPDWPKLASKAHTDGTLVRIRGWRTWDQEHPEQLHNRKNHAGKILHATRATLWEVHPILEIAVKDDSGKWVAIDGGE